ncbi:hypothetical protein CLF_102119, partial [Clonorchis sinensis]
ATANAVSTVITQRIGRLLLVGLNRPHRSNSIDRKTARDLCHVIRNEFEKDENILGGVLYGEGIDFCTGLDFDQLSDEGPDSFGDAKSVRPMGHLTRNIRRKEHVNRAFVASFRFRLRKPKQAHPKN